VKEMIDMADIKRIDIKEFQERGYLQEANRLFFHPLGLALEVIVDEEDGSVKLGGIWDSRDEPEGFVFGEFDVLKQVCVERERHIKMKARLALPCCDADGIQVKPFKERSNDGGEDSP